MRIYRLSEPIEDPRYGIDAETNYGLPGLNCPRCTAWGGTGVYYPLVHFPELDSVNEFRNSWPVSPDRFAKLVDLARPHVPTGAVLPPGTRFGPLVGICKGVVPGFAWGSPWSPLVDQKVLDQLRHAGASELRAAPTLLRTRRGIRMDILQLDILPGPPPADLVEERDLCSICGRYSRSVPDQIRVLELAIPPATPLFRQRHLETVILCSQTFRDAALAAQIPNIAFNEVTVGS